MSEATLALAPAPALEPPRVTQVFPAKQKLRDAIALLPSQATTAAIQQAIVAASAAIEMLEREVNERALDTARKKAGYDPTAVLYDRLGRPRSPSATPGYRAGRPPASKGRKYPPNLLSVPEIMRLIEQVGAVSKNDLYAERLRALILVMWRSGARISEILALTEADLDPQTSKIFIRRGKGGKQRDVGVDAWIWPQLEAWMEIRRTLPPGPLFCVIEGKSSGVDSWGHSCIRIKLGHLAAAAGVRKRVRPHQFRHTHTCELLEENKNIVVIQRQLGHSNLAVTTNYTNGLPQSRVIDAMRTRDVPVLPAFGGAGS